ncbi:hypothetical protein ADEAN_000695900 [Angomonas deanei]|uniref:Uncharacterized protein n=1 Tax=Angomonas deanei TaxID=59799 RepID=A0A7G2CKL2_9TRYP|nr:hypothetical protein ADEAN_000695900 [Angomonas deanei]
MRPQSAGNGSFFFPSASNAWSMPSNNSMVLDNNSIFIANDTTVTILHNNSLNNNNKGTENSSVKTFSKFTAAGAELQEAHFPGCDGSNNNNNSNNSEENGEIKSGLKRSGLSISATDTQFNVLRAEADLIRQMEEMNKTNNINGTPNNTTGRLLEPLQAAPPLAYETTGQQTPTSNSMTNNNNNSTEIPAYIFEKRKEPIDIFLSYIYPMHYNSIVVEHKK